MWVSRKPEWLIPAVIAIALIAATLAKAKIEKTATVCKTGLCLHWWPALAKVNGWHHDQDASLLDSINAEVPDGFTFSNAVAVIYAKAIYKPRRPDTKTLAMLIKEDKATFLAHDHAMEISRVSPLKTADGRTLEAFTYFSREKGEWEEVAYGEEGDYYLVFVISSRTKAGFDNALPDFKEFIAEYK